MKKLALFSFLVSLHYSAHASTIIEEQILTPALADDLGFDVEIHEDDGDVTRVTTIIEVTGPMQIGSNCRPSIAGTGILDQKGDDPMVFETVIGKEQPPMILAYLRNDNELATGKEMIVFIDYLCSDPRDNRRYTIQVSDRDAFRRVQ